jgi:hypothetical protein
MVPRKKTNRNNSTIRNTPTTTSHTIQKTDPSPIRKREVSIPNESTRSKAKEKPTSTLDILTPKPEATEAVPPKQTSDNSHTTVRLRRKFAPRRKSDLQRAVHLLGSEVPNRSAMRNSTLYAGRHFRGFCQTTDKEIRDSTPGVMLAKVQEGLRRNMRDMDGATRREGLTVVEMGDTGMIGRKAMGFKLAGLHGDLY